MPQAHPGAEYLFCYRPHRYLHAPPVRRTLLTSFWPQRIDLFHSLNQRLETRYVRHAIATFHDLFVMTGDYSSAEFRKRFRAQARQAAERSDLIIAVSEFTASQLESLLDVARDRIRVIPHGVRQPASPVVPSLREKTILFVGAIQIRKNVERLVRAFESTPSDWKLVLAGASGYGSERALSAIERSPRRGDIVLEGYVSTQRLEWLFQRASIFAFPSLDEGFGMPVLEAMARGVPVLTSAGSALREVAGDAALLVNPLSGDSIAEGLLRLIRDENLRRELSLKGFQRIEGYSWTAAVDKTWNVYRELLG